MSEHESSSHAQLVSMIAHATPEALTSRAEILMEIAPFLDTVGRMIAARVGAMAWEGEAAEGVRAWGEHFRRESATLSMYAQLTGKAMQVAGQALAEAKSSMPPAPQPALGPVETETVTDLIGGGMERQEAIGVMERLSSSYRVAAETMGAAPEPRFEEPFNDGRYEGLRVAPPDPNASGATLFSGASDATRPYGASVGGDESSLRGARPDSASGLGGEPQVIQGSGVPPGHVPGDDRIGTSLDSLDVAPPAPTPAVPSTPPPPGPVGPAPDAGLLPPGTLPPGRSGPVRPAPPMPQRSQLPTVGRPFIPGGGNTPSYAPSTGHVPAGGAGQNPMLGRPPVGGMPGGGWPPSRSSEQRGILGGVPRPPASATRGVPRGGVIGLGTLPAMRDPATGTIHGPGGGLVGRPSGSAATGGRPPVAGGAAATTARVTGRALSSTTSRRGRRNRNDRDQKEKDR